MKSGLPILLMLILLWLPAVASAGTWRVDPAHSQLGFQGDYEGLPFAGDFPDFQAQIRFDPKHLDQAHFTVQVALASVATGNPERDQALTGNAFFDSTRYPRARYVTQSFTRSASGRVIAHGQLQLRGQQHPLDLVVHFVPSASSATLDVTATVDRLAYGLGSDPDWNGISRPIRIHGHLRLLPAPPTDPPVTPPPR